MKKTFTKIAAVVMAACMLPIVSANAATTANDTIVPAEWYTDHADLSSYPDNHAKVDTKVGYDGNASLHFFADPGEGGTADTVMPVLKVWSTLVKTEIGKEYTLTWYTKGSGMLKTTIYHARANTTEGSSANVNLGLLSGGTLETMSDGWVKHTMNFTSAVGTGRIRFQTQKQADFYLDNISLVANDDETKENLLVNGSFEIYEDDTVPTETTAMINNNWVFDKQGSGTLCDEALSEITNDYAHSGTASWVVTHPEKAANLQYGVKSNSLSVPAGNYTFTFYTRGSYNPDSINILFVGASNTVLLQKTLSELSVKASGATTYASFNEIKNADGWKKHTINLTLGAEAKRLTMRVKPDNYLADYLYIDDISIKDANGKEYVIDGGFEDYEILNVTDLESVMAYPALDGTSGTITWKNPENDNINSITMKVNDEAYTITPDLTSRAFNEVILKDLTEGACYDVELTLTIGDTVTKYTTTLIPDSSSYRVGAWIGARTDNADSDYYANTIADLDSTVGYKSNTSMKVESNRNGVVSNAKFAIQQKVTIDTSKVYYFSFKAKEKNCSWPHVRINGYSENCYAYMPQKSDADEDGWVTYSCEIIEEDDTFKAEKEVTFGINFFDWCDAMWIDDVELRLIDTDEWEPIGDNLLKDAGFEFESSIVSTPKFEYYLEGEEESSWNRVIAVEDAGNYRVVTDIKNISEPEPFKATLILAVYNGGRLVGFTPTPVTVPKSTWTSTTVTSEINVADAENCTLKAMLWNGEEYSLIPIIGVEEI